MPLTSCVVSNLRGDVDLLHQAHLPDQFRTHGVGSLPAQYSASTSCQAISIESMASEFG